MRAVVYHGPKDVSVDEVPDATIEAPTDAIIKTTATNICVSDLHMYEGWASFETGKVLGHENLAGRLALAEKFGAMAIDSTKGDPTEQIRQATGGEGTDRGVEAVGYQAHDSSGQERSNLTMNALVDIVRLTGGIGVVGVFVPEDPGAVDDLAKKGQTAFDFKGQTIATGQADVKNYNRHLQDLIHHGRGAPARLVSHNLGLSEAPDAYRHFDDREQGWTTVLLNPNKG